MQPWPRPLAILVLFALLAPAPQGWAARKRKGATPVQLRQSGPSFKQELDRLHIPLKAIKRTALTRGGPGGQHVNRNKTAYQLSGFGIVVTINGSRYQRKNRAQAEKIFLQKLGDKLDGSKHHRPTQRKHRRQKKGGKRRR